MVSVDVLIILLYWLHHKYPNMKSILYIQQSRLLHLPMQDVECRNVDSTSWDEALLASDSPSVYGKMPTKKKTVAIYPGYIDTFHIPIIQIPNLNSESLGLAETTKI